MAKKVLLKKKNEPIWKWVIRMSAHFDWSAEEHEIVNEISKQSYLKGSLDAQQIFYKNNKRQKLYKL